VEGLFNPVSILLHVINAVILFAALYFLLYKPVRKFTAGRAEAIANQLNEAKATQEEAEKHLNESLQKLKDADREVVATIAKGAEQAQVRAQEIIDSAKDETVRIVNQAKQEAETMVSSTHEAMESEAAALAVKIASSVLYREVNLADHQQLIEEFIKKVG